MMLQQFDRPLIHPDRPRARSRPLKALYHFRKLIADKEDTEQVFHIVHALRRPQEVDRLERFFSSPEGSALYRTEPDLVALLDDHAALRRLPPGTVAHAYCDFMEAEGLTAQGLVDEYAKFGSRNAPYDDLFRWYEDRIRDTHDLMHVLTGYGRDALGEQCVLAFNHGSIPNNGILLIAYAGLFEVRKYVPRGTPLLKAVNEGKRHGKRAAAIAHQPIEALLAEPLDAARRRLNIGQPYIYHQAHAHIRSAGLDPYDVLGTQSAATAA